MDKGVPEKMDFIKWEYLKKWTLENNFPRFTGFSIKIVPEQYGFPIVRYFLSPKKQYYWGTPCIMISFFFQYRRTFLLSTWPFLTCA